MNRRAAFQAVAEMGMAIIVVIIGVLVMSLLGNIKESDKLDESKEAVARAYLDNTVALYLKHKAIVAGEEYTMADLMVIADSNEGEYLSALITRTEEFFRSTDASKVVVQVGERTVINKGNPAPNYYLIAKVGSLGPKAAERRTELQLPTGNEPLKVTITTGVAI